MSIVLTNHLEKLLSPSRKEALISMAPTLPKLTVNAAIREAALSAAHREREGIIAWIRRQRNDVPAMGEEFAAALESQWPGALFIEKERAA